MTNPTAVGQMRCTVCESESQRPIITIDSVPVHCNVLWSTAKEARSAPRGGLDLRFCTSCGHIFNATFDPALMEYTQAYENSLHFSPVFQAYARDLASRLIRRYGIRKKVVIDIGCGKGDFLAMLCEEGENRGFGFDPSYVPENLDASRTERMTIIQDFYSGRYSTYGGDLITCRHVLEHIQEPVGFVRNIARAVESHPETVLFFEVPNALYTLKDLGIWDLIYEHCSYFTRSSLDALSRRGGFEPLDLMDLYGGQFLGVDLRQRKASQGAEKPSPDLAGFVKVFAERYRTKVDAWSSTLESFLREGKRAVIWGGGSKGVTFMNVVPHAEAITHVVDINPRKQEKFVSGSGQEIISPEALQDVRPDVVILMNALYRQEIVSALQGLQISAEVVEA